VDQEYLENFEARCCKRVKISWTDRLKKEEVLHVVKLPRNIPSATKRRKA